MTTSNRHPRGGVADRKLRLVRRDQEIIELVLRAGALRGDQIQIAAFSLGVKLGEDTGAQRRLTQLVRNHLLATLPRRRQYEPAIYVLNRHSVEGNRIMRELLGEEELRRRRFRLGSIPHALSVNELYVRVYRACRDLGWNLLSWQRPDELQPLLSGRIVPDAFFRVRREVDGEARTAGFLIEVERVIKSRSVLRGKLRAYLDEARSGHLTEVFGRALRLLVIFDTPYDARTDRRVEEGSDEARRLGMTFARFAGLDQLKWLAPEACLTGPVWYEPGSSDPVPLFSTPSRAGVSPGEEQHAEDDRLRHETGAA